MKEMKNQQFDRVKTQQNGQKCDIEQRNVFVATENMHTACLDVINWVRRPAELIRRQFRSIRALSGAESGVPMAETIDSGFCGVADHGVAGLSRDARGPW